MQNRSPVSQKVESQQKQLQQFQGGAQQHVVSHKPRTVAWQAVEYSTEEEATALNVAEARIEVTAQCRPKEGEPSSA